MIYDASTTQGTRRQIMALMAEGIHFTVHVPCRTKDGLLFVGDLSFVVAKSMPSGESTFLCSIAARASPWPGSSESGASPEEPPQSDPTAVTANLSCVHAEAVSEAALAQVSSR